MATQDQYNVLRQPTRQLNIKIDLINENDIVIDSFEGIATEGNISLSSESTYRRNGNFTMVFDKKYNLLPSPTSKLWFNKRIGIHIGIKNYFDEIIWFNLGRFALAEGSLDFNQATRTISCQIFDYMAFLDGSLGGVLSHQTIIEEGTPISNAIKSTLEGLVKVSIGDIKIDNMDLTTPYTIERSAGNTVYDLIKELIELYMGWDFYFDENGYFVVEKIKDKKNDPVIEIFDGSDKDLSLNSNINIDFKNVYNAIWVWGRQLEDGTQIKWNYKNKWVRNDYSDLSGLADVENGDICHIANEDKSYMWDGDDWEKLDFRVIPQFNIESIGEKTYVYNSESIFNDEQVRLRCEYELTINNSNMAEKINFSCVPLYNLKPQQKISVNINDLGQKDYIIESITIPMSFNGSMGISARRLYY